MTTLGERIRHYRRRGGYGMEELGQMLGVSRQTVYRYENGAIENVPREKIRQMARIFGVSEAQLFGFEREAREGAAGLLTQGVAVPMLGEIACGEPLYADEEKGSFVLADARMGADFCLRAKGDSMIGARIHDGDVVFVHAQSAVENGEIGAVIVGDEATLKRVYFYPEEQKLILAAENPAYPPLVYIGSELESIRILGRAVAFQSAVR